MNATVISDFNDARALCGAAAIGGDAPAGIDIRNSAEFEQLEAELRRLDSDGPAAVDWAKVASGSLRVLSTQSKDLLVACWATYGLFRTEGYPGLAVGLGILRGMVDAHWAGLFPSAKRERARVGALDWLVGRLAPAIAASSPSESDQPAVLSAGDALDGLDVLLGQKLQKEQASLGELFRALKPYRDEAKRAIAEAAERAAEAARAAGEAAARPEPLAADSTSAGGTAPATAIVSGNWLEFADNLADNLRETAKALRAATPSSPRAYLLNRIGSWLRIDALPPDTGGQTMIFPPADEIAALEAMRSAGQHADIVNLVEEVVWTGPFWLDGHCDAAKALEQIGPDMQPAADAIRGAVALLATRFPAILDLRFNDGRPFAGDETRAWVAVSGGGAAAPDPAEDAVADAHKLLAAGQHQTAFRLLARAADKADGGRARFNAQLAQARFCLDRGFVGIALPLLEHMDAVIAERELETWEPPLALAVAELRYRAITHFDAQQIIDDTSRRTTLDHLKTRIARLDIGVASQLAQQ